MYTFWREVGNRMGTTEILVSYEAFEAYNQDYENTHFVCQDANRRVAEATRGMLLSWFPAWVRSPVNRAIPALYSPPHSLNIPLR